MSVLYIIATPIGNLEDISIRAIRVLKEVDFILCEDTRVTKKLLDYYNIKTKTISYHHHSNLKKTEYILDLLKQEKNLALVSDAGTPGISDPGNKLIEIIISQNINTKIEPIPGSSAVVTALSVSGLPTDKFIFLGFPPHKKGRQKFIKSIADYIYPVVVYESKHRIIKFLKELVAFNKQKKFIKKVIIFRELTKMHETIYRGELEEIINQIKNDKNAQKGEFVVVVG